MKKYAVLQKEVGQTPLECAEAWRVSQPHLVGVPLAYAGRLDPMASGKLLVLIGEECKKQAQYHGLDKEYVFEVLFGVSSDSGDVLGLVETACSPRAALGLRELQQVCRQLVGQIALPYPKFSSKTIQGKPLHTWTLEGRLDEITIPSYTARIHKLSVTSFQTLDATAVYAYATKKIETIPPVTDMRKALGNDFRRPVVRKAWRSFLDNPTTPTQFQVATFRCIASSGTYMRTLAEIIGSECETTGLAYSIHRAEIGKYQPLPFGFGFWRKRY